jgi:hypothetical protein
MQVVMLVVRQISLSGNALQRVSHLFSGFACMKESQFVNHSCVASRLIIDEVNLPCCLRIRDGGRPSEAAVGD